MTTPAKTTILAGVKTALEGITVLAGFKSTVVTVEQAVKGPDEITTAMRPWIGFMPEREKFEYEGPGNIWVTLPVYVGAHVQAATEALVDAAIANLQDDIIAAMFADPRFGETSVDVKLLDGDDDIGDPDRGMPAGETGYSGTFDMHWEISYQRTTGST
jgi:hypothetical protein